MKIGSCDEVLFQSQIEQNKLDFILYGMFFKTLEWRGRMYVLCKKQSQLCVRLENTNWAFPVRFNYARWKECPLAMNFYFKKK